MDKKKYPIGAEHYTLYEEVGQGVSASVHRALCIPFNEVVAVKILDFERDNSDLVNLRWILFLINKCFRISFTLMQVYFYFLFFWCYGDWWRLIHFFFENYIAVADSLYGVVLERFCGLWNKENELSLFFYCT